MIKAQLLGVPNWLKKQIDVLTGKTTAIRLWTNPDRTVAFPAQTVTLSDDISNYLYYEVYFLQGNATTEQRQTIFTTGKIPISNRGYVCDTYITNRFRKTGLPSGTSLNIENAYEFETYGNTTTSVNSNLLIPYRVYGYK